MLFRMLVSCFCNCGLTISKSSWKQVSSIRKKFLKAAASSVRSSWTSVLYAPSVRFLLMYGFVQTFLFIQRFLFLFRRLTYNKTNRKAVTLRECHCTTSAMLQINVCWDLTRVSRVKARVSQHFEVCQHEFANFISSPCEGRLCIDLAKPKSGAPDCSNWPKLKRGGRRK